MAAGRMQDITISLEMARVELIQMVCLQACQTITVVIIHLDMVRSTDLKPKKIFRKFIFSFAFFSLNVFEINTNLIDFFTTIIIIIITIMIKQIQLLFFI
jgi:hypothetical protein